MKNNIHEMYDKNIGLAQIKKVPAAFLRSDFQNKLKYYDSENETAKKFIGSLFNSDIEEAGNLVSKKYFGQNIDLNTVKNICSDFMGYKRLDKVLPKKLPNMIKRESLILLKPKNNDNKQVLMHLYMIDEPDINGRWKIYGIETEREG